MFDFFKKIYTSSFVKEKIMFNILERIKLNDLNKINFKEKLERKEMIINSLNKKLN